MEDHRGLAGQAANDLLFRGGSDHPIVTTTGCVVAAPDTTLRRFAVWFPHVGEHRPAMKTLHSGGPRMGLETPRDCAVIAHTWIPQQPHECVIGTAACGSRHTPRTTLCSGAAVG